jgi:hypothetical protein
MTRDATRQAAVGFPALALTLATALGCAGMRPSARVEGQAPATFAAAGALADDPAVMGGEAAARQLGVEFVVLDGDGKAVAPLQAGSQLYSLSGTHRVRVRSACQPDADYPLDFGAVPDVVLQASAERDLTRTVEGGRLTLRLPIGRPRPERLVVKAPVSAQPLNARQFDRVPPHLKLPEGSEVELVRHWPDEQRRCSLAVVRVVEAGGTVNPWTLVMVPAAALAPVNPAVAAAP